MKKLLSLLLLIPLALYAQKKPGTHYKIIQRIKVPGNSWWDYLTADAATGRLFISHGNMVQVLNTRTKQLIATIPNTPGVHGIALAPDLNKGFISDGHDSSVTVFNLKTLKTIEKIKVTGKDPDAIVYDPSTHRIFTFNGRSGNSTAIDAKKDKVIGTIVLPGSPEAAVVDGRGNLYVNIEDKSQVCHINPKTLKIENIWDISPGKSPSGLAIDVRNHLLFSVCHNEKMIVLNMQTGKVIKTLPIGKHVDGVVFDPLLQRVYSSNGDGTLTVVQEKENKQFVIRENVPTQKGARTIAIDLKTHHVYLSVAKYGPRPAPSKGKHHMRPAIVPGSFTILVIAEVK